MLNPTTIHRTMNSQLDNNKAAMLLPDAQSHYSVEHMVLSKG